MTRQLLKWKWIGAFIIDHASNLTTERSLGREKRKKCNYFSLWETDDKFKGLKSGRQETEIPIGFALAVNIFLGVTVIIIS